MSWWEPMADWLFLTRTGRVCWYAAWAGVVFGLTLLFEHLGWYA